MLIFFFFFAQLDLRLPFFFDTHTATYHTHKMYSRFTSSVSFLSILSLAASQEIQFDGRIPAGTALTAFDADNTFFASGNVVGQNLTFSQALQLPDIQGSIFDQGTVPLEVTIR